MFARHALLESVHVSFSHIQLSAFFVLYHLTVAAKSCLALLRHYAQQGAPLNYILCGSQVSIVFLVIDGPKVG